MKCCDKDGAIIHGQNVADESSVTTVLNKFARVRVIDEKSLSKCTYPYTTVLTAHDVLHGRTDVHTIFGALIKTGKTLCLPIVHIDAESTPEPYIVAMLMECGNSVALNTVLPFGHISVNGVLNTVKTVQTVIGTQPHEAVAVTQTAEHVVVTKAVGNHVVAEHHVCRSC